MPAVSILETLEDGAFEMAKAPANAADKAGGIQVSLSYGQSSSQSNSTSQSDTARGSSVKAGGTVSIKATRTAGASNDSGIDSNLTVQGSDVSGKQINLEADNKVNLLAAQNTSTQTSSNSNSNSSASVGVAAQLGNQGAGLGFTGSASLGKGSGNGTDTTYTNTHIAGQDSVSIKSGGDTTLKGATVEGKQVTATVGGNLNIESLQDTSTYSEKNQQIGASGMIDAGMSGSANFAKSNINSNYQSVAEQSGIKAGDGGFQVDVKGNVDLKGGAITSTQAAIDNNKNTFTKGGVLTTSDIQNQASYEAKSVSVNVGMGSTPVPGQGLSSTLTGAGMCKDSGKASSTTTAGISGMAGDSSKRTGDKEQGVAQIFNKEQVRAEIQAQTTITQEFGKHASKAVGDYAATKLKEAEANKDQAGIAAWREGGSARVALHAVAGGLTGGTAGAVGAGTSQAVIDSIGQAIKETNLPIELKKTLVAVAGTAVGAVASGGSVAGSATAFNATTNNYLKHTELQSKQQQLAACKDDACKKQVTSAWDKVSQERNAKTGNAIVAATVNENLKTMEQLSSDMKGLAQYKTGLEEQLRATSDPTQKANLQQQISETDLSMRQIASQGKDALALMYQQTGDAKYQTALQALTVATSGNEIGGALAIPGGSGGNINKAVQEAKPGVNVAEQAAVAKAKVETNARIDDAQQYDQFRKPNSTQAGGEWDWQKQAPNSGAVPGTQQTVTIQPGATLDRYGSRGGEYMSPAGTTYEARSLPPGRQAEPYEQYPVLKPFKVIKEEIAPAFDQQGGGTQMRAFIPEHANGTQPATVNDLIKYKYLGVK